MIYLDTHVAIQIYRGQPDEVGKAARRAVARQEVLVSPAVVLELEMLHEIGRLKPASAKVIETLAAEIGLRVCPMPFSKVVDCAVKEGWTRDPFDRLIVANARASAAQLATKDQRMLANYSKAIW